MKKTVLGLAMVALALGGCAEDTDPGDGGGDPIDQTIVASYRAALPSQAQLVAPMPEASQSSALGDPALYPNVSQDIVIGINGTVAITVGLLELVTSLPPTIYNSETRELFWGPFPEDIGFSAAYIRETGDTEDFRFAFAFLRGVDNDVANLTPVVFGGATPDETNDDYGVGVVVWDMTAMRAFAEANDPAFDPADHDRGRFAALFASGSAEDEDDPEAEMALVVAAFRDFIPADDQNVEAVDLDYLYGRFAGSEHTVDFIDWQANLDVDDPVDGVTELVGVRMAFLDEGTGRAEADVTGGSLGNEDASVVECWDAAINQTFASFNDEAQVGELANCGLFQATLDELSVPALEDIDTELLEALDNAASNGLAE